MAMMIRPRYAGKFCHLLVLPCLLLLPVSVHPQSAPATEQTVTPLKFLRWMPPRETQAAAFVNVNVVPMDRERIFPNQTVVIRAGHIIAIGPTKGTSIPRDASVIDGTGKYLMPGLVDMHVHIYDPGELLLYLANGVTMVRNLDGRPQHVTWRDSIDSGKMLGPIIWTAGPTVDKVEAAGQGKRLELEQKRAGYNAMEICGDVSAEAFSAITNTARVFGFPLFGCVNAGIGLKRTLIGPQFLSVEATGHDLDGLFPDKAEAAISEAATDLRNARVPITPTLAAAGNEVEAADDLPQLLSRREIRYLPPWVQRQWSLGHNFCHTKSGKQQDSILHRNWADYKKIASVMHRQEVEMLLGTDAMSIGTVPGFSVSQQLASLVEIGLTPFEALETGTRNSSSWFPDYGIEFGTVVLGGRADLLLLDANPLVDVRNVARINGVMTRGRWLPERDLQAMLAALPGAYSEEAKFLASASQRNPDLAVKYLRENDPFGELANEMAVDLVLEHGVEALKRVYSRVQQMDSASILIAEPTVNDLGFELLSLNRNSDALEVFRFNVRAHPASSAVYENLAQAYLKTGDEAEANRYHEEALRADPSAHQILEAPGARK